MREFIVQHKTQYSYNTSVMVSHQSAHLQPISNSHQTCRSFDLHIHPEPSTISQHTDFFGNPTHIFSIEKAHSDLEVTALSEVQVFNPEIPNPTKSVKNQEVLEYINNMDNMESANAIQFTFPSEWTPNNAEIYEIAKKFYSPRSPFLQSTLNLCDYIQKNFEFTSDATDVNTSVFEFLKMKRGVCQDFTHFMLSVIRSIGLPAQYVSGYLLTNPPNGTPRLLGADASHAYIAIFLPDYGWINLDPTNNMICEDKHIVVGYGRDYNDVSVLSGTVTGGMEQKLNIEVTVSPKEDWNRGNH